MTQAEIKLIKEYDYYEKNKPAIIKEYEGKYIAIKDCKIITSGESKDIVMKEMLENDYELGHFLVHLVSDRSDIVQRFHSRIF